jgi:hypothetical protein
MAFLQPDILPAIAEAIHRQLAPAPGGRLSQETLQAWLLPKGIESPGGLKIFRDTLRELITIGALEEDDGTISLPTDVPGARTPSAMREIVRVKAMRAELDNDLWEKDAENRLILIGARDLVRAVAWFLSLSVVSGPYHFERTTPALSELQEQHTGERPIYNTERWPPFERWTRYLGFSTVFPLELRNRWAEPLLPDPTQAIRSRVASLLNHDRWTPIGEVMAALADYLPVLDGGAFRRAIHNKGAPETEGGCSSSLSLAFKRLEANGTIELSRGGGDAITVTFADGHGAYHAMRLRRKAA